jgi:hypothetical protein
VKWEGESRTGSECRVFRAVSSGSCADPRPSTKETVKKEWKDFQTNARFSLFRATKKLSRKAEF